jgi:hypothetical protein
MVITAHSSPKIRAILAPLAAHDLRSSHSNRVSRELLLEQFCSDCPAAP